METIVELVCKPIEHVCAVSNPGEQNQSLACATPIQDLKLHARLDSDETNFSIGYFFLKIVKADISKKLKFFLQALRCEGRHAALWTSVV